MTKASEAAFLEAAEIIGCDIPAIRAVFAVEASGKFFNPDGSLPRRFEPHHFPREHWQAIGFKPGAVKPWRASFDLTTRERTRMFSAACEIDREKAHRAASWGAPQIMGFNCGLAGYSTALAMVAAFGRSADEQVRAFARFVVASDLASAIRAHDWLAFARRYNGNGQAPTYAAKIESAFARFSGGKRSAVVLRLGARGDSVHALQERLVDLGFLEQADGSFGPATRDAVIAFQEAHELKADGVVGAKTWAALREAVPYAKTEPEVQPTEAESGLEPVARVLTATGAGGIVGTFLDDLSPTAELLATGALVLAGLTVLAVWALPRLRRGLR